MTHGSDRRYTWVMLGLLAVTYFLMHASRHAAPAAAPGRLPRASSPSFPGLARRGVGEVAGRGARTCPPEKGRRRLGGGPRRGYPQTPGLRGVRDVTRMDSELSSLQ